MVAPCKNCPDRFPACHDTCEKFKEYREFKEQEKFDLMQHSRKPNPVQWVSASTAWKRQARVFKNHKK